MKRRRDVEGAPAWAGRGGGRIHTVVATPLMKRCRDVEGAPACAGRDATSVLASGRPWCLDCGGRGGGGRVGADGGPVVCRGWRDAADQAGRAVRPVPVVRGAGGDRGPARAEVV